jgi:hypothetical protein
MDPDPANQVTTEPDPQPRSGGLLSAQGWLFRDRVGESSIPYAGGRRRIATSELPESRRTRR